MFSGNNSTGVVGYSKLIAHYESGKIARIYPDTIIYPPMNTRYRLTLRGCLLDKPKGLYLCDKLLNSLASVHNKKVSAGQKIKRFEVQGWSWNFRDNPSDPNYGELVNRHIFNVEEQ